MNKLLRRSKLFFNRNGSTILTCVGAVGVVATSAMAVKATPKALRLLNEAEEEKGEKLTKLEIVKVAGPVYIPSIAVGAATIGTIFGANALNKRQQASLMSAYALLDGAYKEHKKKVTELYGEDANKRISEEIAKDKYEKVDIVLDDNKKLFFDDFSGRYFESTMENVIRAEYEINKKISLWGGAELNEFYELLDIPQMDTFNRMGWSIGAIMSDTWGNWLDFKHDKVIMDDGLECYIISAWPEPMYDYEYY